MSFMSVYHALCITTERVSTASFVYQEHFHLHSPSIAIQLHVHHASDAVDFMYALAWLL